MMDFDLIDFDTVLYGGRDDIMIVDDERMLIDDGHENTNKYVFINNSVVFYSSNYIDGCTGGGWLRK